MTLRNTSKYQRHLRFSIGPATGITTGISAADRAHTVQVALTKMLRQTILRHRSYFPLHLKKVCIKTSRPHRRHGGFS